jgi:hypothetical protein
MNPTSRPTPAPLDTIDANTRPAAGWRARALRIVASIALGTALCTITTAPLRAQEHGVITETLLPDSVVLRVIDVYNRPATTRLAGESRLPAGSSLTGNAGVLNGLLEIGGNISGDVVALNGDIHLLSTANITGSITAAGGTIVVDDGATVTGAMRAYKEMLRLRVDGERVLYVPPVEDGGLAAGRNFKFGRTDLLFAVHGAYNRVEGLPIAAGPRVRIGTVTRLQALGIYRTATGFDPASDRYGYVLNAETRVIPNVRIDASLYREVAAIEDWDLSNREASLAAFVLHRDYRDHFERRGWTVGTSWRNEAQRYTIGLTYRDETDRSVSPRDPVTLSNNSDVWRPEALIAEGRLHTLRGAFEYDTRNDAADPTDGWLLRAGLEQGLGGSLRTPLEAGLPITTGQDKFTTALIDMRRYARLTPYSRIAIRIRAEGALDARAAGLPAQRQLTLGGEGSLPAYPMASFDCGAQRSVETRGETFTAFHGCDRLALTQIEYQASFPLAKKLGEKLGLGTWLTNAVRWSAFFDAGRAWNDPDTRNGRGHGRDDFSADTGLGVHLGPVGIYWAVPLSGSAHEYNFFVRLGPRF